MNVDRDEDEEVIMNLNNINTDDTGDIIISFMYLQKVISSRRK